MIEESWRIAIYFVFAAVWAASLAVRFVPSLHKRFPDLQKPAQYVGWVSIAAIFLVVLTAPRPG